MSPYRDLQHSCWHLAGSVVTRAVAFAFLLLCCLALTTLITVTSVSAGELRAATGKGRQVVHVGSGHSFSLPSQAARVARDGALVEIDAGDYVGDVAVWRQNDLTLRGVGSARPHLRSGGKSAEGKAIWVIKGDRVTVENLEFSGTRVPSHNGAGIRAEGVGLTIRNSRFHHNEMGLLTNPRPDSFVVIEDSEFDHNTTDTERHGRLGHNLYIHRAHSFVMRNSLVHGARRGHQVKTRASHNLIRDNKIFDGDGAASFLLDISDGGQAEVIGNHFEQSARAGNRTAIAFAGEARDRSSAGHALSVVGNTFLNEGGNATFVRNHSNSPARLKDNRIQGRGVTPLRGPGQVD